MYNLDNITTLGQRWQTSVPLADGWRWVHNVGLTLGQHKHVLDEIWKARPFFMLALQHRANVGPTPFFASKKDFVSSAEQHRANVGPTSRFANLKMFKNSVLPTLDQRWVNIIILYQNTQILPIL